MGIAAQLEELRNIPMVASEMNLIHEVQTDEFWQDVTLPMLETVRRRLRLLVKLIEPKARNIVYTDFEDEIGTAIDVALPDIGVGTDKARFMMKMRHFLRTHENHITIQKLRRNQQLTSQDLTELENMFLNEAVGDELDLANIRKEGGLGLFIRSLVGLDREAAKQAVAEFTANKSLSANQIEFVSMVIDYLTDRGVMDPRVLYESPFTDIDDQGVSGVFSQAEVKNLVEIIRTVTHKAAVA
jgi:type I restriction enzyme R subunit